MRLAVDAHRVHADGVDRARVQPRHVGMLDDDVLDEVGAARDQVVVQGVERIEVRAGEFLHTLAAGGVARLGDDLVATLHEGREVLLRAVGEMQPPAVEVLVELLVELVLVVDDMVVGGIVQHADDRVVDPARDEGGAVRVIHVVELEQVVVLVPGPELEAALDHVKEQPDAVLAALVVHAADGVEQRAVIHMRDAAEDIAQATHASSPFRPKRARRPASGPYQYSRHAGKSRPRKKSTGGSRWGRRCGGATRRQGRVRPRAPAPPEARAEPGRASGRQVRRPPAGSRAPPDISSPPQRGCPSNRSRTRRSAPR